MKIAIFLIPLSIGFFSCGHAQNNSANNENKVDSLATPGVIEYLGVNGPFTIGDYTFHLRWSSHPTDNYFKQEYVPTIYELENYIQMVMVELATGDLNAKDVMASKIKEIESRKPVDKLAKYTVSKDPRTGGDVLEFMLSENDGADNGIAEWNVYRYVPYTDSSGKKGIQLFAYSRRGYGVKTEPFKGEIERDAAKFKNNFLAIPVPVIKLK
jgi:hypothetical protein